MVWLMERILGATGGGEPIAVLDEGRGGRDEGGDEGTCGNGLEDGERNGVAVVTLLLIGGLLRGTGGGDPPRVLDGETWRPCISPFGV